MIHKILFLTDIPLVLLLFIIMLILFKKKSGKLIPISKQVLARYTNETTFKGMFWHDPSVSSVYANTYVIRSLYANNWITF